VIREGAARSAALWGGLVLLACAGGGPEWLDGSPEAYPRDRYLVGVGSGTDLDAARDRARAEIARSLEVHVEDEVLDRTESTSLAEGDPSVRTVVEQVSIETRTTTEADLEGVRIAELWSDPATQQVYALAVLDRESAGRVLLLEMAECDTEVEGHLADARVEVDSLTRVRALVQAVRTSRERDVFASRARVVVAREAVSDERGRTAELERELLRAISDVRFAVRAREVYLPGGQYRGELTGLRSGIADRLTGMGFRVEEGRGRAAGALQSRARARRARQPGLEALPVGRVLRGPGIERGVGVCGALRIREPPQSVDRAREGARAGGGCPHRRRGTRPPGVRLRRRRGVTVGSGARVDWRPLTVRRQHGEAT
jgi:hypothetical protein